MVERVGAENEVWWNIAMKFLTVVTGRRGRAVMILKLGVHQNFGSNSTSLPPSRIIEHGNTFSISAKFQLSFIQSTSKNEKYVLKIIT